MNAFVQQDLPDFDPIADFTVCAWILSGNQGSNSMALCIECFELTHSLLCIGEWDHDGHLQAVVYHGENICMRGKGGSLPRGQWLHVVVTQSRDELSFYIDGRLEDTKRWKALEAAETASRVRDVLSQLCAMIAEGGGDAGTHLSRTLRIREQGGRPMGRSDRERQVLEPRIERGKIRYSLLSVARLTSIVAGRGLARGTREESAYSRPLGCVAVLTAELSVCIVSEHVDFSMVISTLLLPLPHCLRLPRAAEVHARFVEFGNAA
jgi:hypothetical protein